MYILALPVLKSKHLRAQTELEDERHSNRKDFCSSFSENSIFFLRSHFGLEIPQKPDSSDTNSKISVA